MSTTAAVTAYGQLRSADPGRVAQTRRSQAAFWISVVLLLFSVGSSALPSPLFPVYAAQWHLGPLMLALVFAVYVGALLLILLTAGSLSDYLGRKPVLALGAVALVLSMALFVAASGIAMLILGRIIQGAAIGLLLGTLGATILDHSLEHRPGLAGLLNGVIPPVALAVGALTSGALVEWAPAPRQLVYVIFGIGLLVLTVLLAIIPESVTRQPGAARSLAPSLCVPAASRRLFGEVAGAMIASWALAGLYLSLVPLVLTSVFGVQNHLAPGALIALFAGGGALTGAALHQMDPRRQLRIGLAGLTTGPIITVTFIATGDLLGVILGTLVAGVGFGAGFQPALRMLLTTAAADQRAELLSAIYVISYLAFGVPSLIAGLCDHAIGLVAAIVGYGAFVVAAAGTALALIVQSSRQRRRREQPHPG